MRPFMDQHTAQAGERAAAPPTAPATSGNPGPASPAAAPLDDHFALSGLVTTVARHRTLLFKVLALALTPPMVLVFFLKYVPDYSFAEITGAPRLLTDYDVFWKEMQTVGTYRARFASYYLHYYTAKGIEAVMGVSNDPRLHPMRLAGFLITTLSLYVVAAPTLLDRTGRWDWRVFYGGLMSVTAMSLYLFLPFDFPALALISLAFVALLRKRRVLAMVLLLACGLFRENNLHIAWFALSMLVIPSLSVGRGWTAAYLVAFFAEYWLLRKWVFTYQDNPIPWVVYHNLISPGSWMIVCIILMMACIAFVVIASRTARARRWDPLDVFFTIQFVVAPAWLVFYLVNGSNWSEFRIQLPTLLPLLYAASYRPPPPDSDDRATGGVTAPSAV